MQRYFFYLIMLLVGVANVQADTALEGHVFRIEPFYGPAVTVMDDGWDEYVTTGSSAGVIGSFQASQGFYALLGFSREYIDEVEINGEVDDVGKSFSARTLGVGYRFSINREQGRFWGIGYGNTKQADKNLKSDGQNSKPVHSFRVFWEKENSRRYGNISISHNTSSHMKSFSVSGRHVWLGQSGFGGGFFWTVGSGQFDGTEEEGYEEEDFDAGMASGGLVLMFRPKI